MSRDEEIRRDLERQWKELEVEKAPSPAWVILTTEEFVRMMKQLARQNLPIWIRTPQTML